MSRNKNKVKTASMAARNYIFCCPNCEGNPELEKRVHGNMTMYHCPTCRTPYNRHTAGRKKNPVKELKKYLKLAKASIKSNPVLKGTDPKTMAMNMMQGKGHMEEPALEDVTLNEALEILEEDVSLKSI